MREIRMVQLEKTRPARVLTRAPARERVGGLPVWQAQDLRTLKRVNRLIEDVARHGNEGIGKPEAVRHDLSGWWSRRITDEHRLVYWVDTADFRRAACRTTPERGRGSAVRRRRGS